jgi:ATP-dependent Clp protease ATP-binding subunit ClpB
MRSRGRRCSWRSSEALRKETDPASRTRLEALEEELAEKVRDRDVLKTHWETEKVSVGRLQKLRQHIEGMKQEMERAERAYDLNRVAELRYGELPKLERQLAAEEQHW